MNRFIKSSFVAIALFAMSCDSSRTALDAAWKSFGDKDYVSAHEQFVNILGDSALTGEALVGLGWTTMRMSVDSLPASNVYFAFSLLVTDTLEDAFSGWTVASWAAGNYTEAITYGDVLLALDPGYVFAHDSKVDYRDIAAHQAYSYFHLGDYPGCVNKIQIVDPSFTVNLSDPQLELILLAKLQSAGFELSSN